MSGKNSYNNDFRYDLKVGQTKERELGNIFEGAKVEVKYDRKALWTKNVYVEYESRGKKSGISTSEADYYCFCFGKTFHLILLSDLKEKCAKYKGDPKRWDIKGGDGKSSLGVLLPIDELF